MRRTIILTLVTCILGTGLWYVFAQDNAPPSILDPEIESPELETSSTTDIQSVEAVGDNSSAAVQEGSAKPQRNAVSNKPSNDDRTRLLITVVDNETGSPIPHASLLYENVDLEMSKLSGKDLSFFEEHGKDRRTDAVLARFGLRTRADAKGQARIPIAARSMYVRGLHEGLYGLLYLDPRRNPPEEGWQVRLDTDINFEVRVQDTNGNPLAGIAVAARIDYDREDKNKKVTKRSTCHKLGTSTEPNGVLQITHFQKVLRSYEKSRQGRASIIATHIVPHIPGLSWIGTELSTDALPSEPLIITVPALASLTVLLRDEQGHPILDQAWIRLTPKTSTNEERKDFNNRWSAATKEGQHTFEHLAIGNRFELSVTLRNEHVKSLFTGPTIAGQEIVETVVVGSKRCIITGRALDESSHPIADTKLSLSYKTDKRTNQVQCKTDSDGRFQAILAPYTLDKIATSLELVKLRQRWVKSSTTSGTIKTNLLLSRGRQDVGDLMLREAPLLVSGQLISEDSERLADVGLRPEYMRTRTSNGKQIEYWTTSRQYDIERGDKGLFTIHANNEATRWRLKISSQHHTKISPVTFRPGTRDLEIKLSTGSSFDVTVLTDKFVKQDHLRLALLPTRSLGTDQYIEFRETGRGRVTALGSEPGKLRYHWQNIGNGTFDLIARLNGSPVPMAFIRDVTLPDSGEDIEIDLRGKIHLFVITANNAIGKPISSGAAVVTSGFINRDMEAFSIRNGEAKIVSADPVIDLLILSRGYVHCPAQGISGDSSVILRKNASYSIKLAFSGTDKVPAGSTFMASISSKRSTNTKKDSRFFRLPRRSRQSVQSWRKSNHRSTKTLTKGAVSLTVPTTGTYSVRLRLRLKGKNWKSIGGLKPANFDVLDHAGPQSFAIEVPESSLTKALAKPKK